MTDATPAESETAPDDTSDAADAAVEASATPDDDSLPLDDAEPWEASTTARSRRQEEDSDLLPEEKVAPP